VVWILQSLPHVLEMECEAAGERGKSSEDP